ncbi:hypothetical protein ACQ4LE_002701, partial [Meloidogyne hapla]
MLSILGDKRNRDLIINNRQTSDNNTSIMLVIIVSIFLIVNLPQALFMAMLCVYNTLGLNNRLLEGLFPISFLLVNNMLVMVTYPINFGIYCFMSSSFRETFKMIFCKKQNNQNNNNNKIPSKQLENRIIISSEKRISSSLVRRSTDPIGNNKRQQTGRVSLPADSCSLNSEHQQSIYEQKLKKENKNNLNEFLI